MSARSTMAPLITRVRDLTNATTDDFTDDQVQAFLDQHRVEFRYCELRALETRAAGSVEYKTFQLDHFKPRMLEGGDAYDLFDNGYNSIKASLVNTTGADLVNGRFVFTTEPSRPVMILSWAYDLYAAAVDLIEEWAAALRTQQTQSLKSVEDNGQKFEWRDNDKLTSLSQLAETYRGRMCVESVSISDADTAPYSW